MSLTAKYKSLGGYGVMDVDLTVRCLTHFFLLAWMCTSVAVHLYWELEVFNQNQNWALSQIDFAKSTREPQKSSKQKNERVEEGYGAKFPLVP